VDGSVSNPMRKVSRNNKMIHKSIRWSILVPIAVALLVCAPWMGFAIGFFIDEACRVVFPERHPNYDAFRISLDADRVENVFFAKNPGLGKFFLKVGGKGIDCEQLNTGHLNLMDFKKSDYSDTYFVDGVGLLRDRSSSAQVCVDSVIELSISTTNVEFSSNKNGPFLKIGCTFDEFKAQFGKPTSWRSVTKPPPRWQ